jgi:hypothetical protein
MMARCVVVAVLGCAIVVPAAAQPRPPAPRKLLEAPVFTVRPQGALSAFIGEGVNVVVGWRPVGEAARYRVTLTNLASNSATDIETASVRFEKPGIAPGRYQLTVTAIDASGMEGALSEALPLNVMEVRATPPGADKPLPPTRGAYAIGTRFSVPAMHCEVSSAPIDDLLVLPENELQITQPGIATLRCAGIPGYLEKQLVIAPITLAVASASVQRGATSVVHVTFASVASIGPRIDVQAFGDITVGEPARTDFGLDVAVSAPVAAKTGGLIVQAGKLELGRIELALTDAPRPPPPPPREPLHWQALDLGGQIGAFFPPTGVMSATTIGRPTSAGDVVTAGPLAGARLGFFPIARVGLEGEISMIVGGYGDESGVSQILAMRVQLAVRAVEAGRFGLRLIGGAGTWMTLRNHGTSQRATEAEVHMGAAVTVEMSPKLWLRFQLTDLVTAARDDGYAHVIETQLGIFTRFGRTDSF